MGSYIRRTSAPVPVLFKIYIYILYIYILKPMKFLQNGTRFALEVLESKPQ